MFQKDNERLSWYRLLLKYVIFKPQKFKKHVGTGSWSHNMLYQTFFSWNFLHHGFSSDLCCVFVALCLLLLLLSNSFFLKFLAPWIFKWFMLCICRVVFFVIVVIVVIKLSFFLKFLAPWIFKWSVLCICCVVFVVIVVSTSLLYHSNYNYMFFIPLVSFFLFHYPITLFKSLSCFLST